ncbi:hypothetical protein [Photobacterium sp. TLY01]|uniref:hypothetical protein n=1 Tax=Photobacterium sp. TLY01 TaxID=2907534 RepID=UPI001F3A641B|nr:hypothetical protein [Photobacterium sp. TLY01]UIP28875.1 hypothetical protein LN341_05185 [Photobacterium sp. TLY01]
MAIDDDQAGTTIPASSVGTIDPSADLSDGPLPTGTSLQNEREVDFRIKEQTTFLWLKGVSFAVVMLLAVAFLIVGLCSTTKSISHIKDLQMQSAQSVTLQSNHQSTDSQPQKSSESKQASKDTPSQKNAPAKKSLMDPMLSAGSIITLVAFMLGVGLTLMLTLIKFTFNNQQEVQQQSVTVAGPLSELLTNIVEAINKKLKG